MREQIHGGDIYRHTGVIDFSVNSNPLGPPKAVLDIIQKQAGLIAHYPDIRCGRLKKAISEFEGVAEEEIICGNGAAELFFAVTTAKRPRRALLPAPSFAEYERALYVSGTEIDYYMLDEAKQFEVGEDILERILPEIDMMFLCNPNNPTGQVTSRELVKKILDRCRECDVLLVLDECFTGFLDEPEEYEMKEYRQSYPNLLIIKAFTKLFCMPGLRLGYGISGNQELLAQMEDVCQPWNVSVLAQEGGVAALADCREYLENTREFVTRERAFLVRELRNLGYRVYGSLANYVFFEGEDDLYERALKAGYLIRDCGNYPGLSKGYYRIAVRTQEENERIAEWLKRLGEEITWLRQ